MEQLVEGGEYTIGVLDGRALASIHIVPAGEYYDYHARYVAEDTQYLCPGLDDAGEAEPRDHADRTFEAINLRGWARVDLMRDRDDRHGLLEATTQPGMDSTSPTPTSAAALGYAFKELERQEDGYGREVSVRVN